MADTASILNNKLVLQYLAAAGQDISSGNPIGTNVNAVTKQAITDKNYMKQQQLFLDMLKNILGGKNTPDGMKATVDKTGMKLHVPSDYFKTDSGINPSNYSFENNPIQNQNQSSIQDYKTYPAVYEENATRPITNPVKVPDQTSLNNQGSSRLLNPFLLAS